jgi:hypothetical protein
MYLSCVVAVGGGALRGFEIWIEKANWVFVDLYPFWENENILMETNICMLNS